MAYDFVPRGMGEDGENEIRLIDSSHEKEDLQATATSGTCDVTAAVTQNAALLQKELEKARHSA